MRSTPSSVHAGRWIRRFRPLAAGLALLGIVAPGTPAHEGEIHDPCEADLDGDGVVGPKDFFVHLRPCLGADLTARPECLPADLDLDGRVGPSDFFSLFLPELGRSDCPVACRVPEFAGTFEAIQERIFEGRGCTNDLCHGAAARAGLDLRRAASYAALLEVPSSGSPYARVEPAAPRKSSLYLKLLEAAEPGTTDVGGAPMPLGGAPLPPELLETVRLWIESAAPATGTVPGTEQLLGACLPDPLPISIAPLPPPAPGEGVHLEMPAVHLAPRSETEVCFATWHDWSDEVPARFVDPTGRFFYSAGNQTRQDPHSHHLVILDSGLGEEFLDDPSFGRWTCSGGPAPGADCDPRIEAACGEGGICRSEVRPNVACIGYGPPGGSTAAQARAALGGAGNGQSSLELSQGLYRKIPLRTLVYWNAHAFNLTALPHDLRAYLNILFTDDTRYEVEQFFDAAHIYAAAGQPPFTRQTYCRTHVFAEGARVIRLSSHQHERGEAFWVLDERGERIYESTTYSDPVVKSFDPPLRFDSPDPSDRTFTFCGIFNNGVAPDGSPDPETVRRRSRTPPNAFPCQPTACAEGRVGAACAGVGDDATCDSTPGAGDGFCDACPITAGVSTQDEMFILTGWQYFE